VKDMLRLEWNLDQLLDYLRSLPTFDQMAFDVLTDVSIVLCVVNTAMRFTDLLRVDFYETTPDTNGNVWKLWSQIKSHRAKESVCLHSVEDVHLDPIKAILELKKRIGDRNINDPSGRRSVWCREQRGVLISYSYGELRAAVVRIFGAAGIQEKRPYHLKHAVLTKLHEQGGSAKDIASFARHSLDSMVSYRHYIAYDGGKDSVNKIVRFSGNQ
jgi:integrase